MKSGYLRASFTIEAAFIVPIVILGIVSMIWVIFYLHNSVAATADLDMCIFEMEKKAAEEKIQSGTVIDLAEKFENVFGAELTKAVAEFDNGKIRAKIRIDLNIPQEGIMGKMLGGIGKIDKEKEAEMSERSENARFIKAAWELIGDIADIIK